MKNGELKNDLKMVEFSNHHHSPLTSFDVSQRVRQHHHKLSHAVQTFPAHVQNAIVGIEIEGVPVSVVSEVLVRWQFVRQQQGHWWVLAMSRQQVHHESAELVDDKRAGVDLVKIDR